MAFEKPGCCLHPNIIRVFVWHENQLETETWILPLSSLCVLTQGKECMFVLYTTLPYFPVFFLINYKIPRGDVKTNNVSPSLNPSASLWKYCTWEREMCSFIRVFKKSYCPKTLGSVWFQQMWKYIVYLFGELLLLVDCASFWDDVGTLMAQKNRIY